MLPRTIIAALANLRKRTLFRNSLANGLGVGTQMASQLISVPVLVSAFGIEAFGVWLLMATIPGYLVMSDLGLSAAAMNEIGIRYARGEIEQVQRVFQSVFMVMMGVCGLIVVAAAVIVAITSNLDGFWSPAFKPHVWAIFFFALFTAAAILSMVPTSAMRATGLYARGTLLFDGFMLAENLAFMLTAILTRNLVATAAVFAGVRVIAMIVIYRDLIRQRSFLHMGFSHFSWQQVRSLLPSALGSMAAPVGMAINLQGAALVVGSVLGPVAVALFVPVRTLSRTPVLFTGLVSRALLPAMSAARGRGDARTEQRLWNVNFIVILGTLCPIVVLLSLIGPDIVRLWTGGRLNPDPLFVIVMSVAALPHALWFYNLQLLSASHEHISLSKLVPFACAGGIALSFWFSHWLGLTGAALGVLAAETFLAICVVANVIRRHGVGWSNPRGPTAG